MTAQKRDETFASYKAMEAQVKAAQSQYDMAVNGARAEEKKAALELAKKLEEKPKQFLVVPEYNPIATRSEFVSKGEKKHKAAHIEVEGTGKATYAVHRHDTKVGELDENEGTAY